MGTIHNASDAFRRNLDRRAKLVRGKVEFCHFIGEDFARMNRRYLVNWLRHGAILTPLPGFRNLARAHRAGMLNNGLSARIIGKVRGRLRFNPLFPG